LSNLFERGGLEQDTGLLRERWQQDGSTLVNNYTSVTSTQTLYTVTSGKTLYMKRIVLQSSAAGDGTDAITFTDGNGGTTKTVVDLSAVADGDFIVLNYEIPLSFTTSVYAVESDAISVKVTFTGWEE